MRVLQFLTAALLSTSALAASKKSTDKFQTFHSRAVSSSPIDLDDGNYEHLTSAPRDYSVAILLTALEAKYGCQLCRDFQPEWNVLGSSWTKGDKKGESRMLFGTLDFAKGKGTFQKVVILNLASFEATDSLVAYAPNRACSHAVSTDCRTRSKG